MNNIGEKIYLSALLHDIGKFYRMADPGNTTTSRFLNAEIKEKAKDFITSKESEPNCEHVLWSAQFVMDHEIAFRRLFGESVCDFSDADSLISLVGGHHSDQKSALGALISRAEALSWGVDEETRRESFNGPEPKNPRLRSVLEAIGLDEEQIRRKDNWHYYPVEKISLQKDHFFPKSGLDQSPDYAILWTHFLEDFDKIQTRSARSFSETLLYLLQQYACTIPADAQRFPDISLFDHSKTAAALAVCLFDLQENAIETDRPFLLIGADFSGIQSYIYQIVSKYAAKNLKGRSFYLRMLSDAAALYLLKALDLPQANIIYNSGGGFYMIAPNTENIRQKLTDVGKHMEEKMFEAHGITLYLSLEWVEISVDTLCHRKGDNLAEAWTEVFRRQDKKKSQKFARLIERNYNQFFDSLDYGIETDKITGEGFLPGETPCRVSEIGNVKPLTKQQIDLGTNLRDADLMIVSDGEIKGLRHKNPIEPAGLGFFFYLVKKNDLKPIEDELQAKAEKVTLITLNGNKSNGQFLLNEITQNGKNTAFDNVIGFEFYGGNIYNGETFDKFCGEKSDDSLRRLGILRMDVDNLGHIFQSGMQPNHTSLARYTALSRSFDYFFSGYLNTIRQELADDTSFIIYSGGDDLFIVAEWSDAIRLAKQIHTDFKEFACGNPAFSVSGGIAILPPKFPIMRGAKESDDEERNTKTHVAQGVSKNSISFMDTPLNWEKEFPVVEKLKNEIVRLSTGDNSTNQLPKSFIGKILQHASNAKITNHKITNLKTYWLVAYDMGRMAERYKDSELKKLINRCKTEICGNATTLNGESIASDYHALELWAFAARWAELEMRNITK